MTIHTASEAGQDTVSPVEEELTDWAQTLRDGLLAGGGAGVGGEAEVIAARVAGWEASFRPSDAFEGWLVEQAATLSVRVDLCRKHDWALRLMAVERAEADWDGVRRLAVEEEGARLARRPAVVARRLRRTPQGCDWLIVRWEGLADLLRGGRDWDESQRSLALDLLGVPAELRLGATRLDPDGAGGEALRAARLALAESEVSALTTLRDETLAGVDESACVATLLGVPVEPDAGLREVRRQEAALGRRMHWALQQLLRRKAQEEAGESAPPRSAPPSPPPT